MVGHVTHMSHVKFISFNATMLNGSLGEEEGEEGKTALIDQRAVAAGKNPGKAGSSLLVSNVAEVTIRIILTT